jgi:hypothetical protein
MKKHNVKPPQESLALISENRPVRLNQKGIKSDYSDSARIIGNGHLIFGLKVASKVFVIIYGAELGKPFALPNTRGRNSVKNYEGTEGRGCDKKRKSACNRLNRGLNLPQPEKVLTYHWYLIV